MTRERTTAEVLALEEELAEAEQARVAALAETRKNTAHHTQVYRPGWDRVVQLALLPKDQSAIKLYKYLAENMELNTGGVVCDQAYLASELGVSTRTVRRWITVLEKHQAMARLPIAGRVCAYILNPEEVWRGYQTKKARVNFRAMVVGAITAKQARELQKIFKGIKRNKPSNV